jgi:hypothetical protein
MDPYANSICLAMCECNRSQFEVMFKMTQYGSLFDYIKTQVEISTCEHVPQY